jgi:hypothetical protein
MSALIWAGDSREPGNRNRMRTKHITYRPEKTYNSLVVIHLEGSNDDNTLTGVRRTLGEKSRRGNRQQRAFRTGQ